MYGVKCKKFTDHQSLRVFYTQKDLNMRQRRWLELINDYYLEFNYHEGKSNVLAHTLSRKTSHSLASLVVTGELYKDIEKLNLDIV